MMMMMMMSALVLNEVVLGHLVTVEITRWSSRLVWISQTFAFQFQPSSSSDRNKSSSNWTSGTGTGFVSLSSVTLETLNFIYKTFTKTFSQYRDWIDFIDVGSQTPGIVSPLLALLQVFHLRNLTTFWPETFYSLNLKTCETFKLFFF